MSNQWITEWLDDDDDQWFPYALTLTSKPIRTFVADDVAYHFTAEKEDYYFVAENTTYYFIAEEN